MFILASCHTSRKATAHRPRQPKFIDDVYMSGHNKNNATANAIDKSTRYSDNPAPNARNEHSIDKKIYTADVIKPREARGLKEKYATILGVKNKEIDNVVLYSFIDDWIGTHYHMGGLYRSGIDCSGFAKRLFEAVFSTELPHSSSEQFNICKRIKKLDNMEEGDLVFFKTKGKHISHVGVYLMNDYFVHASTSQGVVISSLKEEYWQKHLAGAGKIK